ncbi:unnamed protein product [Ixodes hexagonus]
MGRSRSRSPQRRGFPERERERDVARDVPPREAARDPVRDRDVDRERERRLPRPRSLSPRSRNRSPRRRRSRSPRRLRSPRRRSRSRERREKGENMPAAVPKFLLERPPITEKDLEGKTEDEKEMIKLMGFANFDTSKGMHLTFLSHFGHVLFFFFFRQYMNRKGGFNRPLDFVA